MKIVWEGQIIDGKQIIIPEQEVHATRLELVDFPTEDFEKLNYLTKYKIIIEWEEKK